MQRRNSEQFKDMCLQPTMKHGGGSVQVQGCVVGDLFKIDDIINAEKYRQILIDHAVPYGRRLVGLNFIFQHDNERLFPTKKRKSRANSGNGMATKKLEKQPTTAEVLWDVLCDAWNNIPSNFPQKLQDSIPHRINAVLREKGSHTKYRMFYSFSFLCVLL